MKKVVMYDKVELSALSKKETNYKNITIKSVIETCPKVFYDYRS